MSFYTYILRCADGKYYTGHTDDLDRRIGQHQADEVSGFTAMRRPITLAWSQEFPSRAEALASERQIKGWTRRKKEALIRGDWADLHDAAIPPSEKALRLRSGRTGEEVVPTIIGSAPSGAAASPAQPPVIVLVRPQLGENIGKAARAMLNFGLVEMRLVSPRDGWPNPAAGPAASGADRVLADARVFETVADAVADCAHVYATTVRKRGITKPVVTPEAAARDIHASSGRSAILFGPERSGLETEDVALARTILTVPINPEFGSLNLAQAVILVAYEWSKHQDLVSPPSADQPGEPAPQEELDGLYDQLDTMLERTGYYYPPDRVPTTKRTLRTLLTRPGWSSQEVRTMRGVLSALAGKKLPRG